VRIVRLLLWFVPLYATRLETHSGFRRVALRDWLRL
jgi:hypothetical protein